MNRMIAAVFLASTLMGAGVATAMPLAPLAPAHGTDVIEVAGGCGPGWHRGPFGGCRRNFANPAAHACPRGYHIGPYGGCRGNGR
jgi:hypothetical protein